MSIANFWCSKFEQLLNTSHTHTHDADLLLDELDRLITLDNVHEVIIVARAAERAEGARGKAFTQTNLLIVHSRHGN